MKRLILMLFLMSGIASSFISAQQTSKKFFTKKELPRQAWVYDQDGDPEWTVVEKDNGTTLSIIDKKGKKKKLSYDAVSSIKKNKHQITPSRKGHFHYDTGMFVNGSLSINISGKDAHTSILQSVFGWRLKNRLALGMGLSLDFYEDTFGLDVTDEIFVFASAFGYARYNITNTRARLYAFTRVGMGRGLDNDIFEELYSDGVNFHPGIGMTLGSRNTMRFFVELGMAIQKVNGEYIVRDERTNQDITANYENVLRRPLLKIGIEFH